MTLIARFTLKGHPFIFGDTLASVHHLKGASLNLPTMRHIHKHDVEFTLLGNALVPIGLDQKVVIIDDNLVTAWAGDAELAGKLIAELRELRKTARDVDAVLRWIASHGESTWQKVTLIGWHLRDCELHPIAVGNAHPDVSMQGAENVVMAGSGVPHVIENMLKGQAVVLERSDEV